MKLSVTAQSINTQMEIISISESSKDEFSPKQNYVDGKPAGEKLTSDGRKIYGLRDVVVKTKNNDGSFKADKSVSISVKNPIDLADLTKYELTGEVEVTHYVQNTGRIAVSILADGIKPKNSETPKSN